MYNTKLAFRRKLCGIRIKRKQLKRIKQEHLRVKISSYVEKLQESNLDCDFSPVSEENTSAASTYQITKLSNQSTTLIAFYRLNLVNLTQNRFALYDQVSASMMFRISSSRSSVQIWVLSFEQNQGWKQKRKIQEKMDFKWGRSKKQSLLFPEEFQQTQRSRSTRNKSNPREKDPPPIGSTSKEKSKSYTQVPVHHFWVCKHCLKISAANDM